MEAQEYKKLVEELREAPDDWYDADLHRDAADAIEKLLIGAYNRDAIIDKFRDEILRLRKQMPKRGEIVRCGECKWYGIYYAKKDGTPDKRYRPSVCLRGKYAKRRDPDWFCADGEREVQG